MENNKKAAQSLAFWYKTFAITLIVWITIATVGFMILVQDLSTLNRCIKLSDSSFDACYQAVK